MCKTHGHSQRNVRCLSVALLALGNCAILLQLVWFGFSPASASRLSFGVGIWWGISIAVIGIGGILYCITRSVIRLLIATALSPVAIALSLALLALSAKVTNVCTYRRNDPTTPPETGDCSQADEYVPTMVVTIILIVIGAICAVVAILHTYSIVPVLLDEIRASKEKKAGMASKNTAAEDNDGYEASGGYDFAIPDPTKTVI